MALRAARLLLAQIYDLVKHDMSVSAVSLKCFIVLSTVNSTPFSIMSASDYSIKKIQSVSKC